MRFALLVPAAGSGIRFAGPVPKAFIELGGEPLFLHAVALGINHAACAEVIVAAPSDYVKQTKKLCDDRFGEGRVKIVVGGKVRQESVGLALAALSADVDWVLIHDAARPFADGALLDRVLNACSPDCAAVMPAIPIVDTLKQVGSGPREVVCTVDRRGLVAVQTPQALRADVARTAFARADAEGFVATDDAALVEQFRLGPVRVVDGDPRNVKITTAADLAMAADLIAASKTRFGSQR